MAQTALDLAARWDCTVNVTIEPDGNACETGHFIDIEAEFGAVWADMTPWPARFGGAVPHRLDLELGLAGWVLRQQGADPDPIEHVCQLPEFNTEEQRLALQLPARRLHAFADTGDLRSWATRVCHAIDRVLAPTSARWFLDAGAIARSGGLLSDHPRNQSGEYYGMWALDLGQVLPDDSWIRAVWPASSEAAFVACRRGLHEYHEPPCPHLRW